MLENKLAAPLFILRQECAEDLMGVLERLAALGFDGVEFLGLFGHEPEAIRKKLDELYNGNHQGVIAEVAAYDYADVDDILAVAAERGEDPFILMLSEIESPHNLGAIMRTAEIAGVHGIIIPKDNSVGLNATVAKISCGAAEYLPVARVANLVQTAKDLQGKGLWVYGADMDGTSMWKQDMKGPMLLVIGGEDRGIPRLLMKTCDFKVTIPMKGNISSLNASVAAGIMVYEVMRQRNFE